MSSSMDKLAKSLHESLTEADSKKPKPYDTEAEVSRVEGDTLWVKIPGGENETPVRKTMDAKPGDNIMVRVSGGRAWAMGNSTRPPTDDSTANYAINVANDVQQNVIKVEKIMTDELEAQKATIGELEADTAKIHDLTADQLHATVGYIDDLTAENITADKIVADHAEVENLDTNYAHITNGVIDNASIDQADVNNLRANYAHITEGVIDDATIDQAKVNNLSANYAKVNAANIDSATIQNEWVNKILIQTGLIANAGTVYELDALQVNASKIKAGTLDVERLIVTVDGQKYMVHFDTEGSPSYEKLDGNIVADNTITADKIVAGSITTREITAQNLQGTSGWINLKDGQFFYGNGANFASSNNAISWNGSKLQIKADEFLLASGKSIFDEIEAIETWFYATAPTTSNAPAKDWTTTNLKEMHLRDIYFDTTSGKSYRWAKDGSTYKWVEIEDVQLSALAGRVSTNETNISQNTSEIALRAKSADVYTKGQVYTKTETDSAITTKAGEISLSVAQTEIGKIVEGLSVDMTTSGDNLIFRAKLIQGGEDVTSTIPDGDFEWFYRTPNGDIPMNRNGKSITLAKSSQEYGRTVVCVWSRNQYANLLTNTGNKLRISTGAYLIGRSEY